MSEVAGQEGVVVEPGAGAGGGAAAILEMGATAAGGDGVIEGGNPAGDPWYTGLSDKPAIEGQLSDKAWLENKKFADLPSLVKANRELESRFLAGDKIVLPKEGDAPEIVENFYKAIGRPDAPDGYEIKLPDGQELDPEFAGAMREAAHKAGVPAAMFAPLADAFNAHMETLAQNAEAEKLAAKEAGVAEVRKLWGDNFNSNLANASKAMSMLGLDAEKVGKIEDGLGTAETLQLLQRLGAGMGEDALIGGGVAKTFGIAPAAARAELDRMNSDTELGAKLIAGDKTLTDRRKMLQTIVARDEERKRSA